MADQSGNSVGFFVTDDLNSIVNPVNGRTVVLKFDLGANTTQIYKYEGSAWVPLGGSNIIYNVAGTFIGQPDAGLTVLVHPIPTTQTVIFPAGLTGSKGVLTKGAATASSVFSLRQILSAADPLSAGTEFGTMTFGVGGKVATFAAASDTTFNSGDILKVVAPATKDVTLQDLGFTIVGERQI